jgi:hypothetical protein
MDFLRGRLADPQLAEVAETLGSGPRVEQHQERQEKEEGNREESKSLDKLSQRQIGGRHGPT